MTVAFRDSAGASAHTTGAVITIPATVQAGDFMVLVWGSFYPPSADPSGWTRLASGTATGGVNQFGFGCWYKVAVAGDAGAVITVAGTPASDYCELIVGVWSGVDSVRASAATIGTTNVASGSTFSSPTVSATSGDTVISIFGIESATGSATLTYDAAVTMRVERLNNFPFIGETDEVVSSTGTTTARTASPNDSASWASATIALVPAPTPPPRRWPIFVRSAALMRAAVR